MSHISYLKSFACCQLQLSWALDYKPFAMPSVSDLRRQVDHIDRQIVELLSRRHVLMKQIMRILDEEEPDKEREAQILSNWLEEALDYDLDEAAVERVSKAVMELGKKARET